MKISIQKLGVKIMPIFALLLSAVFLWIIVLVIIQSKRPNNVYFYDDKPSANPFKSAAPGYINVNTASKEALMELPGIGEVLAKAIIDSREQSGKFFYLEDLLTVPGIGQKTLERISVFICLD